MALISSVIHSGTSGIRAARSHLKNSMIFSIMKAAITRSSQAISFFSPKILSYYEVKRTRPTQLIVPATEIVSRYSFHLPISMQLIGVPRLLNFNIASFSVLYWIMLLKMAISAAAGKAGGNRTIQPYSIISSL